MSREQAKMKKGFVIGGIVAIIVIAVAEALIVWCTQIRLTAPANVTVGETGMHTIQVSWDEVDKATSYGISIYEEDLEQPILCEKTDKTEIEIDGLYADYNYDISIVAYYDKEDKHMESQASDKITVQTTKPKPGEVEEIQASGINSNSVAIRWSSYETMDTNADGTSVSIFYAIMASSEENGTYMTLADNLTGAEYLHEGLSELNTYYYKVIVQEQMDEVIYSGKESATSVSAITGIGTVSGLSAESVSTSEIKISWDTYSVEKTNADGTPIAFFYTIYAANSETEEFVILAENLTENSYKETNLSPETTRYYKVVVSAQKDGCNVVGEQTASVSAKTQAKKATMNSGSGNKNSQSSVNAEKEAQARVVAQQIADSITGNNDLEKVRQAAEIIAVYCMNSTYTSSDPDYRTPYGLLCKGVYTCAGATRALGLVLECMGYSWEHVNENQWTHQWCKVTMDGKVGWADGMGGIADYGECPFATGEPYIDENGMIYFVP